MKSILSMALFAASICLLSTGCEKKVVTQLDTESVYGQANLKIIYASAYTINYSAALTVNNNRVSNTFTATTPFPGGGLNTGGGSSPWYLAVNSGSTRIGLTVPKAGTNIDSIPLFTGTVLLEASKYYSAYLTDTAVKTKLVLITDDISTPANNTSRYTFVNLMPNVPTMDLYFGPNKVASDVPYTNQSASFLLNRGDTAHWYIRPGGSTTATPFIAVYPALNASPLTVPNKRVLTAFSRGYNTGTGTKVPNLSFLYNQ